MSYVVDFKDVSTTGLESSPVAEALAGLRANEARYFHTKYKHEYVTVPAAEAPEVVAWVHNILETERGLVIDSPRAGGRRHRGRGHQVPELYYESGLVINVLWTLEDGGKRAVGFKLSDGMEVPAELDAAGFKFARQKSKLAGTIRGSYFVIKGDY